jgi:hypothetical protein
VHIFPSTCFPVFPRRLTRGRPPAGQPALAPRAPPKFNPNSSIQPQPPIPQPKSQQPTNPNPNLPKSISQSHLRVPKPSTLNVEEIKGELRGSKFDRRWGASYVPESSHSSMSSYICIEYVCCVVIGDPWGSLIVLELFAYGYAVMIYFIFKYFLLSLSYHVLVFLNPFIAFQLR